MGQTEVDIETERVKMRDCPKCGALAVLFEDHERNNLSAFGLRCEKRCGWQLTMDGSGSRMEAEIKQLQADKQVVGDIGQAALTRVRELQEQIDLAPESEIERLHSDALLEELAALEHERWSHWMRWMFNNWIPENVNRWKRQMHTPYSKLPEHSKESDRKEARKSLAICQKHLK